MFPNLFAAWASIYQIYLKSTNSAENAYKITPNVHNVLHKYYCNSAGRHESEHAGMSSPFCSETETICSKSLPISQSILLL